MVKESYFNGKLEMENPDSNPNTANHEQNDNATTKKTSKSNSIASNRSISMSDTESQCESFHSPLRFDSPLRSDDPVFKSPSDSNTNSKAIVSFDKYFSPLRSSKKTSSENLSFPATPVTVGGEKFAPPPPPVVRFDQSVKDGAPPAVEKVETEDGGQLVEGERRSRTAMASILWRSKREAMVKRAALGFRISEVILCLVSFSVMAADKTQGWSGDSFDRYKEYRYLVAVNVIGFVYSGFQAYDLAYNLVTGKHIISHNLRYFSDFAMDQILAYLLMSASSSAATRVDDWVSNWGKDEFTGMASASIGISFLAFFAFAVSSLICGYSLCNRSST